MEYLEIKGGNPLKGEVRIQGSKNAALPILSAVILHRGTTVLRNCPKIIDVVYMLEILKDFGCRVSWEKEELVIDASKLLDCQVAECYGRQMRSSIMLLGSLLGRMKEACVSYPGGCVIGARPIDLHLAALERLGAVFTEEPAGLKAVCRQPVGAAVSLPFPSVGATENVILLASLAEGTTILENGGKRPGSGNLQTCDHRGKRAARHGIYDYAGSDSGGDLYADDSGGGRRSAPAGCAFGTAGMCSEGSGADGG